MERKSYRKQGSWKNSPFTLFDLWGRLKEWATTQYESQELENVQNKIGSMGCKCFSLNAPGTETLCGIHIGSWENYPFPLLALWGNKNGLPSRKVKKLKIFKNKIGSTGCKRSCLDAQGTQTPLCYPYWKLEEFPFLIISPLG